MTDLGRGSGSEPWHPGDPLYGDPEWVTQAAPSGSWDQYTAPYQEPGHAPPPGAQPWQGAATQGGGGYGPGPGDPSYGAPAGDPYGRQQDPYAPQDPYGGYDRAHHPDPYQQDPYQQDPYQADPYRDDPYRGDPYGGQEGYGHQGNHPSADPHRSPDPYAPQDPYQAQDPYGGDQERQQPPRHDDQDLGGGRRPQRQPGPRDDDWDDDHPFFSDGAGGRARDDDYAEDDEPGDGDEDGGRGRKKRKGKKRRSGCACLVVLLVLGGGVGAVGYFGYQFYQSQFGAAPDFDGEGRGEVQVEIPKGAFSADIAKILFENGVVKSAEAFVEAAQQDDKAARSIQPGVYTLRKEMSAAAALKLLTDTGNLNALTIPEGWRATQVYEAIDKKLGLKKGATKEAAKNTKLGLPAFAKGNPEGFLYPSRYSVGDKTKPAELLRQMVKQAQSEYDKDELGEASKDVGKTPYEIITIASIIQAEAQEAKDFGKVSRVIYNRLDTGATNGRLDMDSTINYALGRSSLDTSTADTRLNHPYNTYVRRGLPPGPIGNPGHQAIEAALNPTRGPWIYFVTVKPGDTRFTADKAEHDRNVAEFNRVRREEQGD